MPFKDEVTAGEQLVYTAIRSENYAPGTAGWRIAKDGTAQFVGVTIAGGSLQSANYVAGTAGYKLNGTTGDAELNAATIRGTLRSGNYVAGSAGYRLDGTTGNAELNQLVARGEIATDVAGNARVRMFDSTGTPPPAGVGVVELYSAAADETDPARIRNYGIGGFPTLVVESPETAIGGRWTLNLPSDYIASLDGPSGAEIVLPIVKIPSCPDVNLSTTGGGLVLGFSGSGIHMALDANEIQAMDASVFPTVASTLNLQNEGGLTHCGGSLQVDQGFSCNVIAVGQAAITPTANVISSVAVTGLGLESGKAYRAVATGNSSVPGEQGITGALYMVTANNATSDGVTLYILRSNTTQTFVYYIVAADDI